VTRHVAQVYATESYSIALATSFAPPDKKRPTYFPEHPAEHGGHIYFEFFPRPSFGARSYKLCTLVPCVFLAGQEMAFRTPGFLLARDWHEPARGRCDRLLPLQFPKLDRNNQTRHTRTYTTSSLTSALTSRSMDLTFKRPA
jgi:hypothetical protein